MESSLELSKLQSLVIPEEEKTNSSCPYFALVTDKPFYSPGDLVTANVHLRAATKIDTYNIEIEIKGKERSKLNIKKFRVITRSIGRRQEETREYYWEMETEKRKILVHRVPVFQFPNGTFEAGDHTFTVQFIVPENIPSTFSYADFDIKQQPQIQVKYTITCRMEIRHTRFLHKHKQPFIIQQLLKSYQDNIHKSLEAKVVSGCCINQGISKIDVTLDKNSHFLKIIDKNETGAKARSKVDKEVSIDLKEIQVKNYPVQIKQAGISSTGISYPMSALQPACQGMLVQNEYNLVFNTKFDGVCASTKLPSFETPVILLQYQSTFGEMISMPLDFNPILNEASLLELVEIPYNQRKIRYTCQQYEIIKAYPEYQ
eukprot:403374710